MVLHCCRGGHVGRCATSSRRCRDGDGTNTKRLPSAPVLARPLVLCIHSCSLERDCDNKRVLVPGRGRGHDNREQNRRRSKAIRDNARSAGHISVASRGTWQLNRQLSDARNH